MRTFVNHEIFFTQAEVEDKINNHIPKHDGRSKLYIKSKNSKFTRQKKLTHTQQ